MTKVTRYTATWCQPCKQLAPLFEQLKTEYPDVIFETIDIDMNKDAALSNGVTGIPTVIIEKDGTKERIVGLNPKSKYVNAIK